MMMKYIFSAVFAMTTTAAFGGGLSCKTPEGEWVGEGQNVYQRILAFATEHERTNVWIVFDLSFEPDDEEYPNRLQEKIDAFSLSLEQNDNQDHVEINGGLDLAPGRYASITVEGAEFLSDHPMVQCLSHLDVNRKNFPEADEIIDPAGASQSSP